MAGSPYPVEVMKQCIERMHERRHHLLWHDGNVTRINADVAR